MKNHMKFTTSASVEQTKKMFPATNPIGFQLDGSKQVLDPKLRTPQLVAPVARTGTPSRAGVVPGPASLVELARALNVGTAGMGPQLMYEWVYSNIEWEPGWGANRGALGTILDGMGNSFDQAELLAELLREAGYTANIVMGTIRLTEAQLISWWNVTDIWGAQSYCGNLFIPIVTAPTWTGTEWFMDIRHVWVEWVDGVNTYTFDPSVKTYTRKAAMSSTDLATAMGFNSSTFLTNAQVGSTITTDYAENINRSAVRSDLESMTSTLIAYLQSNSVGSAEPGASTIDDVLGGQEIVPLLLPVLQTSLPYQQPGDVPTVWTGSVPSTLRPTVQIQFPNWNTPGVWDFTYLATSDQLAGKRLTLFYDTNRVPSLYLDGVVVATGLQQPVGTWTSIYLTVEHPAYDAANYPMSWQQWYQTNWQFWQSYIYTVGSYCIGTAWGNLGTGRVTLHQKRVNANSAAGASAGSEAVLGEKLSHAFYSWCAQNSKVCDIVNRLTNCTTVYSHQIGVISFNNDGEDAIGGDLGGVSGSSSNLANDVTQTPINDTMLAMHGVALEAAVPAQVTGLTPGISTTTVIDQAVQDGNKIYKGTGANWYTGSNVRNTLVGNGFSSTDMDDLYNWYIQWGDTILIHDSPTKVLGDWQGWGYWAYPPAGAFGIINGGIKGGNGQKGIIKKDEWGRRIDPATGQPISWDPIGLVSGDFSYRTTDLQVGSADYPYSLPFNRSYSSTRQFVDGPLGRGWKHCYKISAKQSSDGLLALGEESAIQACASIVELFVNQDLLSDTARPVEKLVISTLAGCWWADQIVNNVVLIDLPDSSYTFLKQPDGSFTAPFNGPSELSLQSGLYCLNMSNQVKYNFNSDGDLDTIVYPFGVTVTCSYSSGKLASVSNGLTRVLTFNYTGDSLTSVSDGTGRSVQFSVDALTQNLDTVTDPEGELTTYVYDQPGRLTEIRRPANPMDPVVVNTYDSLDRVKEQMDAQNNLWQYFLAGSRAEEIDPANNSRVQYFNSTGRVIREIDKTGAETKIFYDGLKRRIKAVYPELNECYWTYDSKSNLLSETKVAKPGSGLSDIVNSWTYDSVYNIPLSHTDGRGNQTTFTLDPLTGKIVSIQLPAVGGLTPTVVMTYNARGQLDSRTDESGIKTVWTFDSLSEEQLSKTVDEGLGRLNLTTSYTYTARGDIDSETDPRGNTTNFVWDDKRRLIQQIAPSPFSYITNYYYDANDNRWKTERETGDPGDPWQVYTNAFNLADQMISSTNPNNDVTYLDYDNMRRIWKITDAESRVIEYAYDAESRLLSVTDPGSVVAELRTYTDNGLVASVTDARSNTTSYSYDGHDRRKTTTYADSSYEENQSIDQNGNVSVYRTRSGNTITRTFDALNRESTRAPQGQATITLNYDLSGRMVKASKPVVSGDPSTGDFEFFVDTAGRFYKEQYPDGKIVEHELDENGNIIRTTWPDGYYIEKSYDELNRLTDILLNGNASPSAHFDWDALSRKVQLSFDNGVVSDFTYALNDDLESISHTFVGSSVDFNFGHDRTHRVVSQQVDDGANYMWHPSVNGTTTYGIADSTNTYPTVDANSLSYDGNGNLSSDGTWSYSYNTESQLVSAAKTGVSVDNLYDPVNRQREHKVGATKNRFIYSGWQRIADYNDTTLVSRLIYGPDLDEALINVDAAGNLTYFSHNHQLSVVATTDVTGAVVDTFSYSPMGESSSLMSSMNGYTGQRFEPESGLYYYKNRYYSSELGRFLQPDPIGYTTSELNLYTYVSNNPLNLTDAYGLWGDWGPNASGPGNDGGYSGTSGYPPGFGPLGPSGIYTYKDGKLIKFEPTQKPSDPDSKFPPGQQKGDVWVDKNGEVWFRDMNGKRYSVGFMKAHFWQVQFSEKAFAALLEFILLSNPEALRGYVPDSWIDTATEENIRNTLKGMVKSGAQAAS